MEQFDIIVIGAGPAGSTAAYRLARDGIRVLLLDKARFPRDKPCGGGLSVRAMRELPFDPQPVVERVIDRLELSFCGRRSFVRGGGTPLASLTQRRRLDHFLVEQAVNAGADFRDGAGVTDACDRGARVDGKWIGSELVIGADGANGSTARSLDLADEPIYGVAFEGNLAFDRADLERWPSTVVIELGTIALDRFPRIALGAVLSPPGWRTLENMLRGEICEPATERGVAGIAVRSFEALVRHAGWPGTEYRSEARLTDR